ncbi:MAG TPA: hypothetical protein VFW33_17840, partial [Gemmataceae bacterium]|nr:hypothetical protein [Gemmataceae bacterium]
MAAVSVVSPDSSRRELREALAEADRTDPGWRSADVAAPREALADEENAALYFLAARRRLPPGPWPSHLDPKWMQIRYLPPPVRLSAPVLGEIKRQLGDIEPALAEARKLKALSRGRSPVAVGYSTGGVRFDWDTLNDVRRLLVWEAAAQADEGRTGEALATAHAILVVGRCVADEPRVLHVVVRRESQVEAVRMMERSLAQGTAAPDDLAAAQALLEDEAAQPVLLNALRSERAALVRGMEKGYVPRNDPSTKRG